jgi:hypothetical protein
LQRGTAPRMLSKTSRQRMTRIAIGSRVAAFTARIVVTDDDATMRAG